MSKARLILVGAVLSGLIAAPAALIPASAATIRTSPSSSSTAAANGVSSTTSSPLLQVCLTVTPKSLAVGINGQNFVILGPTGVPRTCIATPF